MEIDIDHLRSWIGAERVSQDLITPRLAASLAAVLDQEPMGEPGSVAPPAIHWCLSPEIAPMSRLGPDGHPARGDFLPPVPFPRRMWAGGELWFTDDLRVGDLVTRRSRIGDVTLKRGRSGALCFVEVFHDYETERGPALRERHDIVYRELEGGGPAKAPAAPEPRRPDSSFAVAGSPVLLARYSAVTFNGHRIHYDRDYCREVEGYPGLIVHGPLQATFLLQLARRMAGDRPLSGFAFRGTSPLFDGAEFTVNGCDGEALELWVADADGRATMTATARF